jgi:hypothetical protein
VMAFLLGPAAAALPPRAYEISAAPVARATARADGAARNVGLAQKCVVPSSLLVILLLLPHGMTPG